MAAVESTIPEKTEVIDNEDLKVGYTFDSRMATEHPSSMYHPEDPERILRIHSYLQETGLLDQCVEIEIEEATREEVVMCHEANIYDELLEFENLKPGVLQYHDADTYYSKGTKTAAMLSCGSCNTLVREVLRGNIKSGAAVCRPPGHHCSKTRQGGFCHVNNVVVAAKVAISEFGLNRVLIVDWDVHHGDGTQELTYSSEKMCFMSLHRYDKGQFYPAKEGGSAKMCGKGQGKGFNVNVPLDGEGHGDFSYVEIFEQLIIPVATEYDPELILISAGFDSARGDPLGEMDLTEGGYAYMTSALRKICPKIVICLEGGYNLDVIPKMYHRVLSVLINNTDVNPQETKEKYAESLANGENEDYDVDLLDEERLLVFYKDLKGCINFHKPFWTCLQENDEEYGIESLTDDIKRLALKPTDEN